eukprot:Colp12_sorted_trinity150504_noHs@28049
MATPGTELQGSIQRKRELRKFVEDALLPHKTALVFFRDVFLAENKIGFAILAITVHCMYWFFATVDQPIFSLIFLTLALFIMGEAALNILTVTIESNSQASESAAIHFNQICESATHVASKISGFRSFLHEAKLNHPVEYYVYTLSSLLFLAILGNYLNGFLLAYVIFVLPILAPAFVQLGYWDKVVALVNGNPTARKLLQYADMRPVVRHLKRKFAPRVKEESKED